ncbi:uncharacterized protein LOC122536946 [Frieseomelitta varia]|uniref:uncharacterized protein LOC122536946 n=1 Tax=Frieseomelitta varia TaxID=561572 RepID=UPI001CB6A65C|nr:uncharacterized protein LOC122536946 [Frieseomelitta varia]
MIECLIALLLTMSIIANCYIGSVCCHKILEDRSKFIDNESTLIQEQISLSPLRNVVSNVSDRKNSSLNSGETKRTKQVVQQSLDQCRNSQLDSITNATSEVCKNVRIETQADVHATKCTSTNDFTESRHDNDNSSRRNYLIYEKTKNFKLKNFMIGRIYQLIYSRRKDLKANESGRRRNQTVNIPLQKPSYISPISLSQTGTYNLLTSSKISISDTSLRPPNNEVVANNDNKMKGNTEFVEQLQNDPSTISDSTVRNEPSSTMDQTLDKSKRVSIETTKESIVISIKFFGYENSIAVSQTKDDSLFCECPLVKSFNNFLGMFKDIFVELCGSQKASKNPVPRIQITDYSRPLNNSRDETSYWMLPRDTNRSVGNK